MKKLLLFSFALFITMFYIVGQSWQLKSTSDYEDPVLNMTTTDEISGETLTMIIKANTAGTIKVDFGDENLVDFIANANSNLTVSGTVAGENVKVYAPDDMQFTELTINGTETVPSLKTLNVSRLTSLTRLTLNYHKFTSLDVSKNTELLSLTVTNTELTALNVNQLKQMHTLVCSNNKIRTLTILQAARLKNLTCDNNQLTQLQLPTPEEGTDGIGSINCSNNQLTSLDLSKCSWMTTINCSNNKLTAIDLTTINSCVNFNISGNKLTSINIPLGMTSATAAKKYYLNDNELTEINITLNARFREFDCSNNNLKFSTLPALSNFVSYNYAPQKELIIPRIGTVADLSSEAVIDGEATVFEWYKETSNTALSSGTDYTIENGVTTFLREQDEDIYGVLSNSKYPAFDTDNTTSLKTMPITITFDMGPIIPMTISEGYVGKSLSVRMTPTVDGTVYVDFGDGYFKPFAATANTNLNASSTCKGENVKVYLPVGMDITEFRCNGSYNAPALKSLDLTPFTELKTVTIQYHELQSLNLSDKLKLETVSVTYGTMKELILTGSTEITALTLYTNELEELDLTDNTKVTTINASSNKLKNIQLTTLPDLTSLNVSESELESIDISENTLLKTLNVDKNKLKTLDISNNTSITEMRCEYNELESLDISQHNDIKNLYCSGNNLTSIEVSHLEKLEYFYCKENKLTSLDVTQNQGLRNFHCSDNLLTELDITNNLILRNFECNNNLLQSVPVDLTRHTALMSYSCFGNKLKFSTIPAPATHSISNFNYAPQRPIEIPKITDIVDLHTEVKFSGYNESWEVVPIETVFQWMTSENVELQVNVDYTIDNGITTFLKTQEDSVYCILTNSAFRDFRDDKVLRTTNTKATVFNSAVKFKATEEAQEKQIRMSVTTDAAGIIKADFGNGTFSNFEIATAGRGINITGTIAGENVILKTQEGMNVTELQINGNSTTPWVESIDAAGLTAIETLSLHTNKITTIDLTNNATLKTLNLSNNQLENVNVEALTILETLNLSKNNITTIDVSENTALKSLNMAENNMTAIDISANTLLETLDMSVNGLTNINLTANTLIKSLNLSENDLTSLNLSANNAIATLSVQKNQITTMSLTGKTSLTSLDCSENKLTALDISASAELKTLNCNNNEITSLDLNNNTKAHTVDCSFNKLTTLSVAAMTALRNLTCNDNLLTELALPDAGDGGNMGILNCSNNKIASLDLTKNTWMSRIECANNQLTEIDFTGQGACLTLNIANNKLTKLNIPNAMFGAMAAKKFYCENNQLTELTMPLSVRYIDFSCHGNKLTFSAIPIPMMVDNFIYAPQAAIELPSSIFTGDEIDLSSEYKITYQEAEGEELVNKDSYTTYKWVTAAGTDLREGTDYTINEGKTTFINPFQSVYCILNNDLFPEFTGDNVLRTSDIEVGNVGIGSQISQNINVYARDHSICIEGSKGGNAIIFDMTGKVITSLKIESDQAIIPVENNGVVVVKLVNSGKTSNHKVIIN